MPEAQDEGQQGDVQGPEDRRHPRQQPLARIDPAEARRRDEDEPDRDQDQAAPLEHAREGGVEHDREGEGRADRREGGIAAGAEEAEDLDRGDGRDDRDPGRQQRPADAEDDEQDRDEDGRTDGSLTHAPSLPVSDRSDGAAGRIPGARRRRRRARSPARAGP